MKKLIILLSVIFVSICTFGQKGTISLNVFQNSIIILHNKYVPCWSVFNTNVYVTTDTIKVYESWIDSQADCLCTYEISTTIDSVNNGDYTILYYCISASAPFDTNLCHSLQCTVNSFYFGTITKTTFQSECLNAIENNEFQNESYLKQNDPNPFRSETTIEFMIKDNNGAMLNVFNSVGQLIISKEFNQPGIVKYCIDSKINMETGIYYYTLFANGMTETKKMISIK